MGINCGGNYRPYSLGTMAALLWLRVAACCAAAAMRRPHVRFRRSCTEPWRTGGATASILWAALLVPPAVVVAMGSEQKCVERMCIYVPFEDFDSQRLRLPSGRCVVDRERRSRNPGKTRRGPSSNLEETRSKAEKAQRGERHYGEAAVAARRLSATLRFTSTREGSFCTPEREFLAAERII